MDLETKLNLFHVGRKESYKSMPNVLSKIAVYSVAALCGLFYHCWSDKAGQEEGEECVDNDQDNHGENCGEGKDCNDNNPAIYYGAPELCDNLDNNCDGSIDDGLWSCYGRRENCVGEECEPGEERNQRGKGDSCDSCSSDLDCKEGMFCEEWVYETGELTNATFCTKSCSFDDECEGMFSYCHEEGNCAPSVFWICEKSDVWMKDSCDNLIGIAEDCGENQKCKGVLELDVDYSGNLKLNYTPAECETFCEDECEYEGQIDWGKDGWRECKDVPNWCLTWSDLWGYSCSVGDSGNLLCAVSYSDFTFPEGKLLRGLAYDKEGKYFWGSTMGEEEKIIQFSSPSDFSSSFIAPGEDPSGKTTGVAWDGEFLWSAYYTESAPSNPQIFKLSTSGQVLNNFAPPGTLPFSLAWGEGYLWCGERKTERIYKLTPTGQVIGFFDYPYQMGASTGLAWDGSNLWCADHEKMKIFKLSATGQVINYFDSPGENPGGLIWDGEFLRLLDTKSNVLYKLKEVED